MNKKKLGRTLFLIPFIILGISIIFRILYNLQDLLSDFSKYLAILSFFVSPLLLGFGLYLMIKYKDKGEPLNSIKRVYSNIKKWIKKHNTFFSKKVSIKNVILGILIAIISLSALIFITFKIYEYILAERYSQIEKEVEDNKVLGEFSLPSDSPFYADEYVDTWTDEREGYSKLIRHIDKPSYYFKDGDLVTLKDSWLLKNGYELNLVCEEVDLKKVIPGDHFTCEIYYNGKLVVDNVNYKSCCSDFEDFRNCHGKVSFAVFSSTYPLGGPEFLATSYMPAGFDSSISVFNLENGKANRLSFETREGDVYEDIGARVFMFELYGELDDENSLQTDINTIELVNYEWNPGWWSQGIGGLYHIWEIEDNHFVESKSITGIISGN